VRSTNAVLRGAFVALVLMGSSAHAGPANTVTANPVRYALLHFQIDYEHVIAPAWSCFGQPIYFHHAPWYPFVKAPGFTADGYGLDFGCRYFVSPSAPTGLFVGPFLSAYRGSVTDQGMTSLEGFVFSPGVQAGYTKLFGRLALSAGVGGSYGFPTERAPDGSPRAAELPHSGFWVNFRANVGVAF
jgi:hypothetical protein